MTVQAQVFTTSGEGETIEALSARCTKKIVSVSESAPAPIRDQALAYSADIERVVRGYMAQAIKSDRTTVYNVLISAGHPMLADMIRRL